MNIQEELRFAIQRYDQAIEDGVMSERQVDDLFNEAAMLVPNARLSEIIFYSERSLDEVVAEALYREDLWNRGGEYAVLLHVQTQARAVIADRNATLPERSCAERLLPGVEQKLQELAVRRN